MASFDIVLSVGHAYRFFWLERRYLARLALVPCIVKLACHISVQILGYETNFIRQAFVMLPSYFLDGWLLAHVVRFALYGQRWPFRPTGGGDDVAVLQDRAQGILTGIAAYVLIRFLSMGLFSLLYRGMAASVSHGESAADMRPEALLTSLLLLAFGIWAFRLFWLYIPAAANRPMIGFLRRIRGFSTSMPMLGVWLTGFLPFMLFFATATTVLLQPFGGEEAQNIPATMQIFINALWVFIDTSIEIVTTFGMAMGIRPFLIDRKDTQA